MKKERIERKIIEFSKGILAIFFFLFSPLLVSVFWKNTGSIWFTIICELIIILIFSISYRKQLMDAFKDLKQNFKKHNKIIIKYWIYGFLVMAFLNVIINVYINNGIPTNEEINRANLGTYPIAMIFLTVICAPIIEEVIFRLSFRKAFSKMITFAIFSGLIFGAMHLLASFDPLTIENILNNWKDLLSILPYGALGFAFACIYFKTENIFAAILAHCYHNSLTVALLLILQVLESFV